MSVFLESFVELSSAIVFPSASPSNQHKRKREFHYYSQTDCDIFDKVIYGLSVKLRRVFSFFYFIDFYGRANDDDEEERSMKRTCQRDGNDVCLMLSFLIET